MGKASKWIINFLLGKREEKGKTKDITFHGEYSVSTPTSSVPSTPTSKRRWSFGKPSNKETRAHKSSKSLDMITITPLVTSAVSSLENHQKKNKAVALAFPTTESIKTMVTPVNASDRIRKTVEDAAATRIQAAFRSHLARKALSALKGLVKLQALVRGHLVRKQTTATFRRMHALIAIQVRARHQRIQMADESRRVVRSQSSRRHRLSSRVNGIHDLTHEEAVDVNLHSRRSVSKKNEDHLSHLHIGGIDQSAPTKYNSGDLSSMLRQERMQERMRREFSSSATHNSPVSPQTQKSPKTIPGRASFTYKQPDYMPPVAPPSPSEPNYMANTESSKAKARSQSEPKQRPGWSTYRTSKRTVSVDGMAVQQDTHTQYPSSKEGQDPWLSKIYRSTRTKENFNDSKNPDANHCNFLLTYEPHLNMY